MDSDEENDDYIITAERSAKQTYLNEELLNLGYDPQLFMSFISNTKAPDIDLWTIPELESAVKSFKSKHRPEDKASPSITPPIPPVASLPSAPPQPSPAPQEEVKNDIRILRSKPDEHNALTACKSISISVSDHQINSGGIFSGKYVTYTVTTEPLGWVVRRRFSDFYKLREILVTAYLCSYLPPLPSKKAQGNLEEKVTLKRQQYLNQFLIVLSKDELLKASPQVFHFLKETDEKIFKKMIEKLKTKKPETVIQTVNINGSANVEFGDCDRIYEDQIKYLNANEAIKKKIKHKCSQIMEDERKLAESLKKYAEIVKELRENQRNVQNNKASTEMCNEIYESLLKWSKYETENVVSINQDLRIPFSISFKEMDVLKELIKEREGLYSNFKKLELKQKPDRSRDALERSKEMYGYSNYKAQREVERVLTEETNLAYQHFLEAAKRQAERTMMFNLIWGNLMQKLSVIKFEEDEEGN